MPNYQYIARNSSGDEVAGLMQADSEAAVARTLDERRLFPVRVTEQQRGGGVARRSRRIRLRDLAVVYGQLADLQAAGVPLLRSLETLSRAITNAALSDVITAVRNDVAEGKTLADAM